MQSRVVRNILVLLLVGMVVFFSGCGKSNPKEQTADSTVQESQVAVSSKDEAPVEKFELPGEYAIDMSKLGMALTVYLRIDEDNNFTLAANRQFAADRGKGTIGELDGTYLMIYSDSTPEKSKTATFERLGHNLIFRSPLPYGSASISCEAVDAENPELIHQLMANKYVYEEFYDTYLGFTSEDGVLYEYVLQLGPGARYNYVSSYAREEETLRYEENGSFRVLGKSITIKPQDEPELSGTITADGGLNLQVKSTATSKRNETLLRVATTAKHAGSWYGQKVMEGLKAEATLDLDYFGGYTFTALYNGTKHVEKGSFEATANGMTFAPSGEATTPVSGTKANYTLTVPFKLSETGTDVEWLFYDAAIQGQFTGATNVAEAYKATLHLQADGSYDLLVVDPENDLELLNQTGTFTITPGPMAYNLTLNSPTALSVGEIWPSGLNMAFEIDGTTYSFMLTK